MIPLAEEVETRRRAPITVGLVVLMVAVWLPLGPGQEDAARSIFAAFGLVPAHLTAGTAWTLVTYAFLHASLPHIATNMLFLWVFGRGLEGELRSGYLPFFLICGVVAGLASVAVRGGATTPTVGASGAISGILGAYLVLLPHTSIRSLVLLPPFWVAAILRGDRVTWDVPAWMAILTWFGLQVAEASAPGAMRSGIDHAAHVGGFLAGYVIIRLARDVFGLWPDEPEYERVLDRPIHRVRGVALPTSYVRASRVIAVGVPIRPEDLEWVRRGNGYVDPDVVPGQEGQRIIGRVLRHKRYRYEPIRWEDLEPLEQAVSTAPTPPAADGSQ